MRRKSLKQKNGQFIIIAVLFIATMIISIGAMLASTSTYYKYEPWEEYITLIDGVKLNSHHLVELSLSNYTLTNATNPSILRDNLEKWQNDLAKIYPGYGISLNYEFLNDNGIDYSEYNNSTSLTANVNFYLNLTNLGLEGYEFNSVPSLNLTIHPYDAYSEMINVTVTKDEGVAVFDLEPENFEISGGSIGIASLTSYYDEDSILIYSIKCETPIVSPVSISVCDNRGLKLIANP